MTTQIDTRPFVTITEGMRGFFAVLMCWNQEHGGFWEPWNSSDASFETYDEAIPDAKCWAEAENIEFKDSRNE